MPDARYIAVSFSVEDIEILESLSEKLDASVASIVRGMAWQIMDSPDLMATVRPSRHVHNKKKWRKSISLARGDQSDSINKPTTDRE